MHKFSRGTHAKWGNGLSYCSLLCRVGGWSKAIPVSFCRSVLPLLLGQRAEELSCSVILCFTGTTPLGDSLRLFFIFGLVRTKTKGSFCPRRIVSLACITADDGIDGEIQFFDPDPRSQHRPLRPGGAPQVPRVPRKQDTATTARTLRVLQSQSRWKLINFMIES